MKSTPAALASLAFYLYASVSEGSILLPFLYVAILMFDLLYLVMVVYRRRAEEAEAIAHSILAELLQPSTGSSLNAPVSVSIGIAFGDSATKNKSDILRNADAALYRAKANGRGRIEIFDEEMAQQLARSLRLQADLSD